MDIYRWLNRGYRDVVPNLELRRSLDIITASGAIGNILFANTGGAALTGYASAFGAGTFVFGLISALPVLASLAQLYVSYLVQRTGKSKFLFMLGGLLQRSFWVLTAFIPLFVPREEMRVWVLLALITSAAMAASLVNVTHVTMMAEVVPMRVRGRFITSRQQINTLSAMLAGLGAAFVLDHVQGLARFMIVFGVGGVCGLIDILFYTRFTFPIHPPSESKHGLWNGAVACFKTPRTRDYLFFWIAWSFAVNMASPFFNKYALEQLQLSYTQVILFGQITCNVISVLVLRRWGRFLDQYGAVPLLVCTCSMTALGVIMWLFAAPGSVWALFMFNFLGGFFWCGTDASSVNMQLSHTPDVGRPVVIALYAVVTSVSAAVSFILGGAFLEVMEPVMLQLNWRLMGQPLDHYKLLFALNVILRAGVVAVFLPRVWNEKEIAIGQAYSQVWANSHANLKRNAQGLRRKAAILAARVRMRFVN
jgi:MFS family permease